MRRIASLQGSTRTSDTAARMRTSIRTLLLVSALAYPQGASQAQSFGVTAFAPSAYSSNTGSMDAVLGISSFVIEDFSSTALASRLSYRFDDLSMTFSALPNLMSTSGLADFANNAWDTPEILLSNAKNNFPNEGSRSNSVTFLIQGGATSFGVGLSNFQSLNSGLGQFPITNHEMFINGVSYGQLESMTGWVGGRTLRNLYVRVDAIGTTPIQEISFRNLQSPGNQDLLAFDHLAFSPANISTVPEPTTLALVAFAMTMLSVGRAARRRTRLGKEPHPRRVP